MMIRKENDSNSRSGIILRTRSGVVSLASRRLLNDIRERPEAHDIQFLKLLTDVLREMKICERE